MAPVDGSWLCRLWWPRHLLQLEHQQSSPRPLLLLGWIAPFNGSCFDVVIATAVEDDFDLCPPLDVRAVGSYQSTRNIGTDCNGHLEDKCTWLTLTGAVVDDGQRFWTPRLETLVFEGEQCRIYRTEIVFYRQPRLWRHHLSLYCWEFCPSIAGLEKKTSSNLKKPQWLIELEQQERHPNLDVIVEQLNVAAALENSLVRSSKSRWKFWSFIWCLGPTLLLANLYYAAARAWFMVLSGLPRLNPMFQRSSTFGTLNTRFNELSSWLTVLRWCGEGPCHPNVAVAHRLGLMRHSVWSKILVDLLLGAAVGYFLLVHQSFITIRLVNIAGFITNTLLRTGCIWLMGAPAGFKLNNELAAVMGTASLNAIHVFSILWSYILPYSGLLLKAFAVISILFGSSVSAALAADVLFLAMAHVILLQRATAFVYGSQLKILAALWRLFRGRKHNPLRNRADSYEYTSEQLVVASLIFTPSLLLLPTTSIFYTFFTIMYTTLSTPRFILQVLVAVVSYFPYAEAGTWCIAKCCFPSGLRFDIVHSSADMLVLSLDSTFTGFGELLQPFFKQLFSGLTTSVVVNVIYNLVSGGSLLLNLDFGKRAFRLPHATISLGKFWQLSCTSC